MTTLSPLLPAILPALLLAVLFLAGVFAQRARRNAASGANRGADRNADRVTFTEVGATRTLANGKVESVAWADLVGVGIMTTSEGPWAEDVWWLLIGADGTGVAVPNGQVGDLVGRVARLPGADLNAVILAMGSTDDASFPVWRGERGAGVVCREVVPPTL